MMGGREEKAYIFKEGGLSSLTLVTELLTGMAGHFSVPFLNMHPQHSYK